MLHSNSFTADINPRNAGTCGLFDIAGQLGQAHRGSAYLARLVAKLIAERGFPVPLPTFRAGQLRETVNINSRWSSPAVDAWFESQIPAALAPAAAAAAQARTAATLANRAKALA